MRKPPNELKVGIAVLISTVILVGGIMWGKGYRLNVMRYPITVEFSNIGGLEVGANVLANGVAKGRVSKIELHGGKVYVRANVDNSVKLYSDYKVTIESPTVMAGKVLALYPGEKMPYANVDSIMAGQPPLGMGEAVELLQGFSEDFRKTLGNLNLVLGDLHVVVGDTANQRNLAGFLSESRGAASEANRLLREDVRRTLANLDAAVESVQKMSQGMEPKAEAALSAVDSAANQMAALALSLRGAVDMLKDKNGTIGKLTSDTELYDRLLKAVAQVDSLAYSIRTKGLRNRIVIF